MAAQRGQPQPKECNHPDSESGDFTDSEFSLRAALEKEFPQKQTKATKKNSSFVSFVPFCSREIRVIREIREIRCARRSLVDRAN